MNLIILLTVHPIQAQLFDPIDLTIVSSDQFAGVGAMLEVGDYIYLNTHENADANDSQNAWESKLLYESPDETSITFSIGNDYTINDALRVAQRVETFVVLSFKRKSNLLYLWE